MSAAKKPHGLKSTLLSVRLKERIARNGHLSVADYMEACLSDKDAGYYPSRQPIGREGDFITAPEVSQIFGELLGLWAVAAWQSMGEPRPVVVAELGPGRGTLLADALRAWRSVPDFLASVTVALVETSPARRCLSCGATRCKRCLPGPSSSSPTSSSMRCRSANWCGATAYGASAASVSAKAATLPFARAAPS
jgi:hypothetical protein